MKLIKQSVLIGLIGLIMVLLCILLAFLIFSDGNGIEKHFISNLFSIFAYIVFFIFFWGFISLLSIIYDVTQIKVLKILLEDNEVTVKNMVQEKNKLIIALILNSTFLVSAITIQFFFIRLIFRL